MNTKRLPLLPLLFAPLLLIVCSAHAQAPNPAPWQTYTIKGEEFAVALPILPSFHTTYEYFEGVRKPRRIFSIGSYADGVVYVVYVYENPNRESLKSFLKRSEIPESSSTDITLDGFSGKERRTPEFGISQFFATKDRLYHFMAMGAAVDDPRITKFFSALSLRRKPDSIEVVDGPGLPYEDGEPAPSDDPPTQKLFIGKAVDRKARLAMKPEPSYTEEARQKQITGTVVLKVVFSRNGSVTNIRTVSGLPYGLTEKAIDAARKMRFIPAIKDGKYVSMWMQLEYNFNLY